MSFTIARRPDSLCETCSSATIIKDAHGIIRHQTCGANHMGPVPITFKVRECTSYDFRYSSESWEHKERAWILQVRGKEVMGFRPPKRRGEKDEP